MLIDLYDDSEVELGILIENKLLEIFGYEILTLLELRMVSLYETRSGLVGDIILFHHNLLSEIFNSRGIFPITFRENLGLERAGNYLEREDRRLSLFLTILKFGFKSIFRTDTDFEINTIEGDQGFMKSLVKGSYNKPIRADYYHHDYGLVVKDFINEFFLSKKFDYKEDPYNEYINSFNYLAKGVYHYLSKKFCPSFVLSSSKLKNFRPFVEPLRLEDGSSRKYYDEKSGKWRAVSNLAHIKAVSKLLSIYGTHFVEQSILHPTSTNDFIGTLNRYGTYRLVSGKVTAEIWVDNFGDLSLGQNEISELGHPFSYAYQCEFPYARLIEKKRITRTFLDIEQDVLGPNKQKYMHLFGKIIDAVDIYKELDDKRDLEVDFIELRQDGFALANFIDSRSSLPKEVKELLGGRKLILTKSEMMDIEKVKDFAGSIVAYMAYTGAFAFIGEMPDTIESASEGRGLVLVTSLDGLILDERFFVSFDLRRPIAEKRSKLSPGGRLIYETLSPTWNVDSQKREVIRMGDIFPLYGLIDPISQRNKFQSYTFIEYKMWFEENLGVNVLGLT